jgi:predicted dehydrogenase
MNLALIGCGGMGLRHTYGFIELCQQFDSFRMAAVCDRHEPAANHVAGVIEQALGYRPKVYLDFDRLLENERLDAVSVVTDTRMHHVFASRALEAGLNVITEKPMGLTMKACRLMDSAARKARRTLAVAENYRRDPMNRLSKTLIEAGAIGTPYFTFRLVVGGGSLLMHNTGWRALKARAGSVVIEQGVHDADLMVYFLGDIDTVYAETGLFQRVRKRAGMSPNLAKFYQHRVEDQFAGQEVVEQDQEDTAIASLRFDSGAIGHFGITNAAIGHGVHSDTVHGSEGTLVLPPSRSGKSPQIRIEGRPEPITGEDLLKLVPDFELDDITAPFWNGTRRMGSYDMPFEFIDRKVIAVEYQDFARAILDGREPEVGAEMGAKALGVIYSMLESGHARQPVKVADVISGRIHAYQDEVDAAAGL